jgi:hypothetical protein
VEAVEQLIAGTLDQQPLLADSAAIEQWLQDHPSPCSRTHCSSSSATSAGCPRSEKARNGWPASRSRRRTVRVARESGLESQLFAYL